MSKRSAIYDIDGEETIQEPNNGQDQKRTKVENQVTNFASQALTTTVNLRNASLVLSEKASRLSSLSDPELHFTGHEGAIYSIDFDSSGKHLASGSMDKNICEDLILMSWCL